MLFIQVSPPVLHYINFYFWAHICNNCQTAKSNIDHTQKRIHDWEQGTDLALLCLHHNSIHVMLRSRCQGSGEGLFFKKGKELVSDALNLCLDEGINSISEPSIFDKPCHCTWNRSTDAKRGEGGGVCMPGLSMHLFFLKWYVRTAWRCRQEFGMGEYASKLYSCFYKTLPTLSNFLRYLKLPL